MKKKYEYIPKVVECILTQRSSSSNRLKDKVVISEEHPKHRQATSHYHHGITELFKIDLHIVPAIMHT